LPSGRYLELISAGPNNT
jgi:hypothetical protein